MKQEPRFLKAQVDGLQESIDRLKAAAAQQPALAPDRVPQIDFEMTFFLAARTLRRLKAASGKGRGFRVDC